MKKVIQVLILLMIIFGFNSQPARKLLSTISIGKYSYKIYKQTTFVHDENKNIDFFVVYGKHNEQQCGAYMLDKKNDTIRVRGQFSFNEKYLEFREYYFSTIYDSVVKRFYPNKNGKLILLRFIEYKNGIEKITKY